jgi:hypothetical protein
VAEWAVNHRSYIGATRTVCRGKEHSWTKSWRSKRKKDENLTSVKQKQLVPEQHVRCWQRQRQRQRQSREEVALGYRLPIFVLPCPDYAIRRIDGGAHSGNSRQRVAWLREAVLVVCIAAVSFSYVGN